MFLGAVFSGGGLAAAPIGRIGTFTALLPGARQKRRRSEATYAMAESEAEQGDAEMTPPTAAAHAPSRAQRFLSSLRRQLFRPATTPEATPQPAPSFASGGGAGGSEGGSVSSDLRAPGALLLEEGEPSPDEDCPICLGSLVAGVIVTPCSHKFHSACLEKYFLTAREPGAQKARCPLCRATCHAPLPVEVSAASHKPIEIVSMPAQGARCHFDRPYSFMSLGGFADRPNMLYLMTSNEDRKTPRDRVMWTLQSPHTIIVHLNFRSSDHVRNGERCRALFSTGSSAETAP